MNNGTLARADGLVPRIGGLDFTPPPLDCVIRAGTITCLIGPFGAAKEAYLRALAGVEPALSGDLVLLDQDCACLGPDEWRELRRQAVYILRDAPLLSGYDGFRNVMVPALYHHIDAQPVMAAKAQRLIAETGVDFDLDALPAYLSEYQRRYLAIVRGLMLNPEILFIDDTFRQLDHEECHALGNYLTRLTRRHDLAVVASTFDLGLARQQADQIVFLTKARAYCFNGWQDMLARGGEAVRTFLDLAAIHFDSA